jgi:hypothetical protein
MRYNNLIDRFYINARILYGKRGGLCSHAGCSLIVIRIAALIDAGYLLKFPDDRFIIVYALPLVIIKIMRGKIVVGFYARRDETSCAGDNSLYSIQV